MEIVGSLMKNLYSAHLTPPEGVLSAMACLQQSDFGRVFGSCGAWCDNRNHVRKSPIVALRTSE